MGEVRKLQKKLRQIENLEIKISLTPEERFKISRKAELRSRLAELQLQLSGPQQTLGIVGDGKKEKMKRQVEDAPEALPSQTPPASKILKGEEESKTQATPAPAARRRETGGGAEIGRHQERTEPAKVSDHCRDVSAGSADFDNKQRLRQEEAEFTSLKSSWEKAKFRLRLLEGHNDIVTCVVAVDNLVVSGSRDTTVKVWHVPTATEHKNLGGHTSGVTCLSAPPPEYCKRLAWSLSLSDKERFILSGSADCYVKIWALSIGQCVKSIYTFNAVTALCFVPEEDGYIITGSDAGKVQAWSWHTFENCQSINAHQEAVTSIQSQGPLVFSGSAEGGVSVWENQCSDRDPLRLLHHWSGQVTGCGGGPGGRLTLSPRGDRVFLAYGRAWLKILYWRTGTMSRLTNHSSITGVTDCVHQTGGLLIGSCYDLANGESSLNLFSLPQCRYLASLNWPDAPRILCFAAWTTGSGDHRWVTGGRDLLVWEQLPSSGKQRGDITAKRDTRLESCFLESEGDTEDDEDTDDYEDNDDNDEGKDSRSDGVEDGGSGSWFRCVLHVVFFVFFLNLPPLK
ncbi:pre-mRNA-splicing factor PRP46 isoform X2 [Siniperca chuatsi]|uniref:pre-mRNA-splicing factor PRP46 isoform X2 n=1 Tax=Siniperca chuatsi TaxID=119488 RepID=UPI001CE0639D|nr:pre-mRNA-splicing factor PRP46 isoform X2 [Siniperca chuatsi]